MAASAPDALSCGGVLGAAATARNLAAGHVRGAISAEIRFLCTPPVVAPAQAHDRALLLGDLFAAVVADDNCFPCHGGKVAEKPAVNLGGFGAISPVVWMRSAPGR